MSDTRFALLNADLMTFRGSLWYRAKARKAAKCAESGKPIKVGDYSWRQMGNKIDRYIRISDAYVQSAAPRPHREK